jgi:hypothetical protein
MLSQSTSATVRRGCPVCGTRTASSSEKSLSFVMARHRIDIASPSPSQLDDLSCCRAATVPARLACIGLSCVLASLTAAVPLAVHACHLVCGLASRHGQRFRCDHKEANVHVLTCYLPLYPRIPPLLSTRSTTFHNPASSHSTAVTESVDWCASTSAPSRSRHTRFPDTAGYPPRK